jgi:drug/metabolite transporter (DMT)-like permease
MQRPVSPRVAALALVGGCVVVWGLSFRLAELALAHTGSTMLAALRTIPAAPLLVALVLVRGGRLPRGRALAWALLAGLLLVAVYIYGLNEAIARAGPGIAAVLTATPPFFVLAIGFFALRERVSPLGLAGLVLGFAGVVMIVSAKLGAGGHGTRTVAIGIALALAAALASAVGILLVKWLTARDPGLDMIAFTGVQYVLGGVVLGAVAFGQDGTGGTDWGSGRLWAILAFLVIGSSAYGSVAYFTALKHLPATQVAAAQFLVPVVAVVVEIARGNAPAGIVLAGMLLTIAGVGLVNAPAATRAPA